METFILTGITDKPNPLWIEPGNLKYTPAEIGYLAGIIDGEGSIYIGNFSSNPKNGSLYYQTNIEVTNTSENLIDWLVKKFGGRKYKYTEKQTPKNSRQEYYRWIVSGKKLEQICILILPHVQIKQEQVLIMLRMRQTFKRTGMQKGKQGIQPLDNEVLSLRKELFEKMQSLHCRNYKK